MHAYSTSVLTDYAGLSAMERLALLIAGLCRAVAARVRLHAGMTRPLPGPLIILIDASIRRVHARVRMLVERINAGTLGPEPAPRAPRARNARDRERDRLRGLRLPTGFAWLIRLVPYEAAGYASQLRYLLEDPAIKALLAASPRVGRALMPLCRMLGIEPDVLFAQAAQTPAPLATEFRDPPSVAADPPAEPARSPPMAAPPAGIVSKNA